MTSPAWAWLLAGLALAAAPGEGRAAPVCDGVRHRVSTEPVTGTPYVLLDLDGRTGPWLVDFGTTRTALYADSWPPALAGQQVRRPELGFPGAGTHPRDFPVVEGGRERRGVGVPLGLVGTDLLKDVTTELHFDDPEPYLVFATGRCDRAALARAGFLRIDQAGFFDADPAARQSGLPNVPVVRIELEERSRDKATPILARPRRGAATWAQVDTGYSDPYWPYSVDVNEAYLADLKRLVPALTLVGLVPVAGCGREDTVREVYVAPGWRLRVVADGPDPARAIRFDSFHLIVKPRASSCGGIGPLDVPAAQLGSSFLRAFGTTVFMPATAELWIAPP